MRAHSCQCIQWIVLAVFIMLDVSVATGQGTTIRPVRVTLDFNEVDLQVVVRFMSELTGKQFVLDERVTGKVTIYSPTKVTVEQAYNMFLAVLEVRRLAAVPKDNVVQIVQVAEVPPERNIYVYKLKHASATDTATVLTNLVARSTAPATAPSGRPPLRPVGEFEAPVQVYADKATNSLIVSGTTADYGRLQSVLRELDVVRRQVFVEAVILEIGVNRLRQIGNDPVQIIAAGKAGAFQGIVGLNRIPEDITAIAQTLSGVASGGTTTAVSVLNTVNVRAFLQFLLTLTDTNILSTPQVLASDNQKAKIVVGENRPFPTGQAQGITGGTLVTIERRDVGVTLEMTPQVLENDQIRLDVKQEITAIAENVAQTIGSGNASVPVGPTTTKRSMETITVARDRQTVVVGGLVRDNLTIIERKVPLLGDIPLLGWLFRSQSRQVEKLNLLVFLTPHIVRDVPDVVQINVESGTQAERLKAEGLIQEPTGTSEIIEKRLLIPPNSQVR